MYSVYIIDNEPFTVLWLKQLFHRPDLGFECIGTFTSVQDALGAILATTPDLIISDIRMPGMDGLAFMKYLSQNHVSSEIILVSAYSNFSYAQEALRGGALDYLIKPVSKEDVESCYSRVKRILSDRSRPDQAPAESLSDFLSHNKINDNTATMKSFIEQHYMQPIRLQDLADHVHLNESYCSVLFKKSMGISFSQYLINIRMEKAQKLLQSKTLSVSQVGALVGYSDLSYFSKEFKKRYGVTPTKYKSKEQ